MLRELHIANLAVIEDAAIELDAGLNVFTGETGAGKSLVLGAFELLLGLRTGTDMLRSGQPEGRVSGLFELRGEALARQVSELADQTLAPGEQLLMTRKLFASGRSSLSLNGQPATAAMARAIGELLVDIHGQHDHQYLLRPAHQLVVLDAFAGLDADREAFGQSLAELRRLEKQRAELAASGALRRQQLELYEFQAGEIDAVDPQAGELPELEARHGALANVQRIRREAGGVHAALYDAEGSVVERMEMMARVLAELAELDGRLAPLADQLREATLSSREAAFELGRYADRLEDNPDELAEVESRLNQINRLVQKYGDGAPGPDPAEPVLRYRAQIAGEIDRLRSEDQDLGQLDARIAAARDAVAQQGRALSERRAQAGKRLTPRIEAQLKELGMPEAQLTVRLDPRDPGDPEVGGSGLDRIEFMVRTNPGQDARPLRRIASGGELSRIMLALKSVLAASDRISVLVFDEIDANIGGRLGGVIGRKLRELAHTGGGPARRGSDEPAHQVLCISHLPQIAAFADRHFRIAKEVTGRGAARQTRTRVEVLRDAARVDELAEMMAGKQATDTTRRQARELLDAAD